MQLTCTALGHHLHLYLGLDAGIELDSRRVHSQGADVLGKANRAPINLKTLDRKAQRNLLWRHRAKDAILLADLGFYLDNDFFEFPAKQFRILALLGMLAHLLLLLILACTHRPGCRNARVTLRYEVVARVTGFYRNDFAFLAEILQITKEYDFHRLAIQDPPDYRTKSAT